LCGVRAFDGQIHCTRDVVISVDEPRLNFRFDPADCAGAHPYAPWPVRGFELIHHGPTKPRGAAHGWKP